MITFSHFGISFQYSFFWPHRTAIAMFLSVLYRRSFGSSTSVGLFTHSIYCLIECFPCLIIPLRITELKSYIFIQSMLQELSKDCLEQEVGEG